MERRDGNPLQEDALTILKRFEETMKLIKQFPIKSSEVDLKPSKWEIPKPPTIITH